MDLEQLGLYLGLYVNPQYQCDLLTRKGRSHKAAQDNRIAHFSERNSGRALATTRVEDKVRATTEYGHSEESVNLDEDAKISPRPR